MDPAFARPFQPFFRCRINIYMGESIKERGGQLLRGQGILHIVSRGYNPGIIGKLPDPVDFSV